MISVKKAAPYKTLLYLLLLAFCCKAQSPFIFRDTLKPKALGPNVLGCSLQDGSGRLWFGTSEQGLFCYDGKAFIHFSEKDGLSDRHIFSLLEDKTGLLWVGTFDGLFRYNGSSFTKVPLPHGYKRTEPDAMGNIIYNPDCILSLFQDKTGNIWLGSMGFGVYRYDGKVFTFFTEEQGLRHSIVQCMLQDQKGTLWLGTRGDGIWTYNASSFRHYSSAVVNNNHLLGILEDRNGDLWFSTVGGGVRHYHNDSSSDFTAYDGKRFDMLTKNDQPCFHNVSGMLQDRAGSIWFCGDGSGVCVYNGASYTSYTTKDGLISNRISSVLEDSKGHIWLGTRNGGLCRYDGKTFVDFSDKLSH